MHYERRRMFNYIALARQFAAMGHLPAWRQWLEIIVIALRRGVGPGHYFIGRMSRRDIPLSDKLSYYNGKAYVRRIHELNDPLFFKSSQHKIIEASILNYFGVPTPQSFGYLHPSRGMTCDGESLKTPAELMQLLHKKGMDKFVLKPCEGFEGRGFLLVEIKSEMLHYVNDEVDVTPDEFFKKYIRFDQDGYLVQKYFVQHSQLASLHKNSVNTVRMMVFTPKGEKPKCIGAYLRIGHAGAIVDNASAGGISATIDVESGQIAEPGIYCHPSTESFIEHPDSGTRIQDFELPFWDEAKSLAIRAIQAFPNIRYVGLDIAFGENGPVIIELNVQPDYSDFAQVHIPSIPALSDNT